MKNIDVFFLKKTDVQIVVKYMYPEFLEIASHTQGTEKVFEAQMIFWQATTQHK